MNLVVSKIQENPLLIEIISATVFTIFILSITVKFMAFIYNKINSYLSDFFSSNQGKKVYTETTYSYRRWLFFITFLVIVDLVLLIIPKTNLLKYFEYGMGLSIALIII